MPSTTASGYPYPLGSDDLADTDLRIKALADFLEASANSVRTAWAAVTFTNSWVNYGSGFQEVQYRKVGDMVQLRGTMKNGTTAGPAFTLPVGFRPPAVNYLFIPAVTSDYKVAACSVNTSGAFTVSNYETSGAGNGLVSLFGLQFSVTA